MGTADFLADVLNLKTITEPLIAKDIKESNGQIQELLRLLQRVRDESKREEIYKDMLSFQYGLDGEKTVMYELKNSSIPMIVLHDIRLVRRDQAAQLDFILITHNFIMILETKKLMGDIEINADGDFIRHFKSLAGKTYKKEGIYSPVIQNKRHLDIFRKVMTAAGLPESVQIKSGIVIANPRSIINKKMAPKDIQNQIFKSEQISTVLKSSLKPSMDIKEKRMRNIAGFLKNNHVPAEYDLVSRYNLSERDLLPEAALPSIEEAAEFMRKMKGDKKDGYRESRISSTPASTPVSPSPAKLETSLKKYRTEKAKEEGAPAYAIFLNAEMEEMIQKRPKSLAELGLIKGFSKKKMDRYGKDITAIISSH